MIELCGKSIILSEARVLVCPVHCTCGSGMGLSHQFKVRFPRLWERFDMECRAKSLRAGQVIWTSWATDDGVRHVAFAATIGINSEQSHADNIRNIVRELVETVQRLEIESIAIPALGCGCGGMIWYPIEAMLRAAFEPLPQVRVILYPPQEQTQGIEYTQGGKLPADASYKTVSAGPRLRVQEFADLSS